MRRSRLVLALLALASPAAAQLSVVGNGVEEHQVLPGASYSGTIRVRNAGAAPEDARVYLTDYTFTAAGESSYGEPGRLPRSNAAWIRYSPAQVRIAPGGEATIGYTITVPAGAAPGSFWSMLMVESVQPPAAMAARRGARVQLSVGVAVRYGVQIATTVPGAATRAEFAGARAVAVPTGKRLEFDLLNAGAVAFRPTLRLELYDEAGTPVGTFTAERGLLYPGTSLHQGFDLGQLASGSYQALITADTGGDEVFAGQYRVRL